MEIVGKRASRFSPRDKPPTLAEAESAHKRVIKTQAAAGASGAAPIFAVSKKISSGECYVDQVPCIHELSVPSTSNLQAIDQKARATTVLRRPCTDRARR
jgi:hypothetical protein